VELPFNVPQFEGLPHLRLEKVDNFSIFLNLAFMVHAVAATNRKVEASIPDKVNF
jgi:hypothetical protein